MNTEPAKILKDEDCIAHVKAQVMTRDDGKGGWVPLGCGGMSTIGLCRAVSTVKDETCVEFFILGRRIADKSIVLKCPIKKDLQYTKANPTFHHWKAESGKFGLTFQSSTEARLFEKSIRKLVDSLKHGCSEKTLKLFRGEDQEHFMKLNLPLEKKDSVSQPESTASTTVSTPSPRSPSSPQHHPHHHPHHHHHDDQQHPHHHHPEHYQHHHHHHYHHHHNHHHQHWGQHQAFDYTEAAERDNRHPADGSAGGEDKTSGARPPSYFTFPPLNVKGTRARGKNSCVSLPNPSSIGAGSGVGARNGTAGQPNGQGRAAHQKAGIDHGSTAYVQPDRKEAEFQYSYPQFDSRSSQSRIASQILVSEKNILPSVPGLPSASPHVFLPQLAGSRSKNLSAGAATTTTAAAAAAAAEDDPSRRLLGSGSGGGTKSRCVHCHETFVPDENRHGSCPEAPDSVVKCIERVSCCCCARAFVYHCLSDDLEDEGHGQRHQQQQQQQYQQQHQQQQQHRQQQGEFNSRSCCSADRAGCRRWMALAFLSLAVPCLCCYWPMTACHSCGVSCGICGGKHTAMT